MTMYKRNAIANNNQLLTIYQSVHITHFIISKELDLRFELDISKLKENFFPELEN